MYRGRERERERERGRQIVSDQPSSQPVKRPVLGDWAQTESNDHQGAAEVYEEAHR